MRVSTIILLTIVSFLIPALASAIPSCEYICSSPYPEDEAYCRDYCGGTGSESTGFVYTYYAFSEGVCTSTVVGNYAVSCEGAIYSWGDQTSPCWHYETWTTCALPPPPVDPGKPISYDDACIADCFSQWGWCETPGECEGLNTCWMACRE